ncbi:Autophagy-related protein 2 [Taphrina deformans PYCC 5710]|uniref:Autophagy-related protein 2 n=1 Tax=Taphrina deformans (strain PYCC 5710 / ATCC 11124 / CBS 356.35 / IMI 108563 / JCM 9778 / NBRC 8474) TaxID=1097556 RepID=R4XE78_TAPDE|nr:Autophagy-related protein 2 [Taphrina deformans PYCC 5710]|eukprot:CCG82755.1 Autophagy-related protein 2 [Taphrina deformans PYCC 5710]
MVHINAKLADLGIALRSGQIGLLRIIIPWSNLLSGKFLIVIGGLKLVVGCTGHVDDCHSKPHNYSEALADSVADVAQSFMEDEGLNDLGVAEEAPESDMLQRMLGTILANLSVELSQISVHFSGLSNTELLLTLTTVRIQPPVEVEGWDLHLQDFKLFLLEAHSESHNIDLADTSIARSVSSSSTSVSSYTDAMLMQSTLLDPGNDQSMYMSATSGITMVGDSATPPREQCEEHDSTDCCLLNGSSITGSYRINETEPSLEISCGPIFSDIQHSDLLRLFAFLQGFSIGPARSEALGSSNRGVLCFSIKLESVNCALQPPTTVQSGYSNVFTSDMSVPISCELNYITVVKQRSGKLTIDLTSFVLALGRSKLSCTTSDAEFCLVSIDTTGNIQVELLPLLAEIELEDLHTLAPSLTSIQSDFKDLLGTVHVTERSDLANRTKVIQLECPAFLLKARAEQDINLELMKPVLRFHSDKQKTRTSLSFDSLGLVIDGQPILNVTNAENSNVVDYTAMLLKPPQPTLEFISYESLFEHRERDNRTEQGTLKALKEKSKALSDATIRASLGKLSADLDQTKIKLIHDCLNYARTFLHSASKPSQVITGNVTPITLLLAEVAELQVGLLMQDSESLDLCLKKASLFHVSNLKNIDAAAFDVFEIQVSSRNVHKQEVQVCKMGLHTTSAGRSLPMFAARYRQNSAGRRKGSKMFRLAFADVQLEFHSEMSWIGPLNHLIKELDSSSTPTMQKTSGPEIAIDLTNVSIGLNPYTGKCKGLLYFRKSVLESRFPLSDNITGARFHAGVVDLFLIDDIDCAQNDSAAQKRHRNDPVSYTLLKLGFVRIASVETAEIVLTQNEDSTVLSQYELNVVGAILTLHTCADSLATFLTLLNSLRPPAISNEDGKYKLAATDEQSPEINILDGIEEYTLADLVAPSSSTKTPKVPKSGSVKNTLSDISESVDIGRFSHESSTTKSAIDDRNALIHGDFEAGASTSRDTMSSSIIDLRESLLMQVKPRQRQLFTVKTQKCFIVWNIHDGYDWESTRSKITQAIEHALEKAQTQDSAGTRKEVADEFDSDTETEDSSEIGDLLFNSIYISLSAGAQREDVARAINKEIAVEDASDTATQTTHKGDRSSQVPDAETSEALRLGRSKMHKVRIEISGIDVDFSVFDSEEDRIRANTTISIHDLEIVDNVSTSTWHKFLTYDRSVGTRAENSKMAYLNIVSVKPMADLAAAELAVEVVVAPLRLHVDQDTLEFLTRFFEFKDELAAATLPPPEETFFQKIEILPIPIQIDYKPKRLDLKSLRSGRTTELKNLFILEESQMFLKHVVLYGICGTSRMVQTLNDIWLDHIKTTQLSNVLAGVSAIRSFASFSGGLRKLVMEPISDYRRDGRLVPGMKRGIGSFVKTTGNEAIRLGAKLAIGTQGMLESAEHAMSDAPTSSRQSQSSHAVSMYADQPNNLRQGISQAIDGMSHHVGLAKEALTSLPRELEEETDARRAATAAAKSIPVAVLRPLIGTTEMISKTLLGLRNTMNPQQRRLNEDKYKHTD